MIQVIKLSTIHNTQPTSIWSGLRNIEQKLSMLSFRWGSKEKVYEFDC